MNKIVIIGLDGVPYGLLESLSDKGIMPNFHKLKQSGVFKKMESSIPEISSVSWSSIITGKNPGEHNIFGFTDLIENTYSLSFPNFSHLKAPAFWQKNNDKKHVILNVPSTYPAQEINGVLVAGFVALDLEKATYPNKHLESLKEMNYIIDVDAQIAHESKELFLEKLSQSIDTRTRAYRYFWDNEKWDTFMFIFTETDRLGHFFWDAYEDTNNKFHQGFLEIFKKIDKAIGEISSRIDNTDTLIMLSDHGMELSRANLNVNYFLRKEGFLKLNHEFKNYNKISFETTAFALDPGRIYLNKQNKYPRGSVAPEQEKEVLNNLIEKFEGLEKDGKKVIKKVFRKEEIYHGPFLDKAPDLILLPNSGFSLKGNINKECLFEEDVLTGKHTQDDAFLFVKGTYQDMVPENPSVIDVISLIER